MLIISQNATDYDLNFPKDAILRINLAWCNSLDELEIILKKNSDYGIFIDLPIGRLKPPNNRYTLEEIIPLFESYQNIKYFAISNVEKDTDLDVFLDSIPKNVTIIGQNAFQESGLIKATINVDMLGNSGFPTSIVFDLVDSIIQALLF